MKQKLNELFRLLSEGYTTKNACLLLGIDPKATNYYYKKYNIQPVNKYSKYNIKGDYFSVIDSEDKAYFLGLVLADGCVSIETKLLKEKELKSYRLSISLQEEDQYLIDLFSEKLGFKKDFDKISNYQGGALIRKPQRKFRFNNKFLVNTLIEKYKIKPRKTYDTEFEFPFETIPEELQRHFIRGFFDGDGSVSFYLTNKSFFFNFSFVFTSKIFTEQIAKIFENLFNIKSKIYLKKGKTVDWFALRFDYSRNRGNKIKEIYDWLYLDSEIFMTRKKDKFNEYFKYLNTEVNSEITKGSESL